MKNFIISLEGEEWVAFTTREAAQECLLSLAEENIYEIFCEMFDLGCDIETYFKDQKRHMERANAYRKRPFTTLSGYQLWRNSFDRIIEVEVFD